MFLQAGAACFAPTGAADACQGAAVHKIPTFFELDMRASVPREKLVI